MGLEERKGHIASQDEERSNEVYMRYDEVSSDEGRLGAMRCKKVFFCSP